MISFQNPWVFHKEVDNSKCRSKPFWRVQLGVRQRGCCWNTLLLLPMGHLCSRSRGGMNECYHQAEGSWQRHKAACEPRTSSSGLKTGQCNSFRKGTSKCLVHESITARRTFPFFRSTESQLQDKMMWQKEPCTNVFSIMAEWADSRRILHVRAIFSFWLFLTLILSLASYNT